MELFSNDDGDDSENITIKMNSCFFWITLEKKNFQLALDVKRK